MALVKTVLKAEIKGILNNLKDELDQDAAIDAYAEQLTNAIDSYIRSATITVTGTAGSYPVTGTGIIS